MQELPPKKDVATFLLQRTSVFIHLDPRAEDVIVPSGFKKEAQLILQIGYDLPRPIPDLNVDESGWSATLSFRSVPFRCVVPWKAVFAMATQDGRYMVWPEDVPPEVQQQRAAAKPAAVPSPGPAPAVAPVPAIAAVPAVAAKPTLTPVPSLKDASEEKKGKGKAKRAKKRLEAAPDPVSSAPETPAAPTAPGPTTPVAAVAPVAAPAAPAPAGAADGAENKPAAPPAPEGARPNKPKRELPSYLRVIK